MNTDEKPLATMRFFSTSILLEANTPEGGRVTRRLTNQSIADVLSQSPAGSPVLPENCVSYARINGMDALVIYMPPVVRSIKTPFGEYQDVPMPGLVFGGVDKNYKLFAVKERPLSGSSRLYYPPVPNIYNDGRICLGTNTPSRCASHTMHLIYKELLEDSLFTNHLVGNRCSSYSSNIFAFLESLQGQEEFPYDELIYRSSYEDMFWGEEL